MKPDDETAKRKRTLPDFPSWVQRLFEGNEEAAASKPAPALYLVATPIGNRGDITLRALWVLQGVDAVLCEDTRVTGALLHAYGIKKPLISCHDHNEAQRAPEILARLERGESFALVSDAGTPLLSDPGFRLVRECRAAGLPVVPVPGASALLTALSGAGLPTDAFFFAGFLPTKTKARREATAALAKVKGTLVFYESPQRLAACLADLAAELGADRRAVVGRELTKLYEDKREGTLGTLAAAYAAEETPKGEIVLLVESGANVPMQDVDIDALLRDALKILSVRDAAASVAAATGRKKGEVYQRALILRDSTG